MPGSESRKRSSRIGKCPLRIASLDSPSAPTQRHGHWARACPIFRRIVFIRSERYERAREFDIRSRWQLLVRLGSTGRLLACCWPRLPTMWSSVPHEALEERAVSAPIARLQCSAPGPATCAEEVQTGLLTVVGMDREWWS